MAKVIMTVDDSASIRAMVKETLEAEGFDVLQAEDGQDALSVVEGKKVDLFISDINMPNMNGIELVKELRSRQEYKFTPILMLTTEASPAQKQEGKQAGATGWIVKPFKPEKMLTVIRKVLR